MEDMAGSLEPMYACCSCQFHGLGYWILQVPLIPIIHMGHWDMASIHLPAVYRSCSMAYWIWQVLAYFVLFASAVHAAWPVVYGRQLLNRA